MKFLPLKKKFVFPYNLIHLLIELLYFFLRLFISLILVGERKLNFIFFPKAFDGNPFSFILKGYN